MSPFGGSSSENLSPGTGEASLPVSPFPPSTASTPAAAAAVAPHSPAHGATFAGSLVGCASALTQRSLGKSRSKSSSRKILRRRATTTSGRTVSPHLRTNVNASDAAATSGCVRSRKERRGVVSQGGSSPKRCAIPSLVKQSHALRSNKCMRHTSGQATHDLNSIDPDTAVA